MWRVVGRGTQKASGGGFEGTRTAWLMAVAFNAPSGTSGKSGGWQNGRVTSSRWENHGCVWCSPSGFSRNRGGLRGRREPERRFLRFLRFFPSLVGFDSE